jgi:hypothetical protein
MSVWPCAVAERAILKAFVHSAITRHSVPQDRLLGDIVKRIRFLLAPVKSNQKYAAGPFLLHAKP